MSSSSQFISGPAEASSPAQDQVLVTGSSAPAAEPSGRAPMFNDGADHYENLSPSLWNQVGNALVAAADLLPGQTVLDLCSGTGSSTLPAAQEVGASGSVISVDVADQLIGISREKAALMGLSNVEFIVDDASAFVPERTPDVILMGLAIFLFPQPEQVISHIRSYMGAKSTLVLSTWAQPGLSQLLDRFMEAARRHNADLYELKRPNSFQRIDRLADADRMHSLLESAGLTTIESAEVHLHLGFDADLLWDFVLGTGLRTLLSQDGAVNEHIKADFTEGLLQDGYFVLDSKVAIHRAVLVQVSGAPEGPAGS